MARGLGRLSGVAVVLLLVLLLAWLGPSVTPVLLAQTPTRAVPSPDGPTPSTTPATPGAPGADDDLEGVHRAESLHIWLRELTKTRFVHGVPDEPFDAVWPAPADPEWDPALFEDIEADDAIRGLSGPGTPFKGARGEEALALALDGLRSRRPPRHAGAGPRRAVHRVGP